MSLPTGCRVLPLCLGNGCCWHRSQWSCRSFPEGECCLDFRVNIRPKRTHNEIMRQRTSILARTVAAALAGAFLSGPLKLKRWEFACQKGPKKPWRKRQTACNQPKIRRICNDDVLLNSQSRHYSLSGPWAFERTETVDGCETVGCSWPQLLRSAFVGGRWLTFGSTSSFFLVQEFQQLAFSGHVAIMLSLHSAAGFWRMAW